MRTEQAKVSDRDRIRALAREADRVKLGADGMLLICRVCSDLANGKETFIRDLKANEHRAAKKLIGNQTLKANYDGRLFPTDLGFLTVRNLAPIPLFLKENAV